MSTVPVDDPVDVAPVPLSARERRIFRAAIAASAALVLAAVVHNIAYAVEAWSASILGIIAMMIATVALVVSAWQGRRAVRAAVPIDGVRRGPQVFDVFASGELSGDEEVDVAARALAAGGLRERTALLHASALCFAVFAADQVARGLIRAGWETVVGGLRSVASQSPTLGPLGAWCAGGSST